MAEEEFKERLKTLEKIILLNMKDFDIGDGVPDNKLDKLMDLVFDLVDGFRRYRFIFEEMRESGLIKEELVQKAEIKNQIDLCQEKLNIRKERLNLLLMNGVSDSIIVEREKKLIKKSKNRLKQLEEELKTFGEEETKNS